jgi:hypothetical protein
MDWAGQGREIFRHEQWRIGVVEAPLHRFLEPGFRPEVRWLLGPRQGYYADPFGWTGPGGLEIFCEAWEASTDCGRIVRLDANGKELPLLGFEAGQHTSYPFLLEADGAQYCIPETWQAGEVLLYKKIGEEWRREATLLAGVPLADATVFRHGDRWRPITAAIPLPTSRSGTRPRCPVPGRRTARTR